jgi:hypothetical protein
MGASYAADALNAWVHHPVHGRRGPDPQARVLPWQSPSARALPWGHPGDLSHLSCCGSSCSSGALRSSIFVPQVAASRETLGKRRREYGLLDCSSRDAAMVLEEVAPVIGFVLEGCLQGVQ